MVVHVIRRTAVPDFLVDRVCCVETQGFFLLYCETIKTKRLSLVRDCDCRYVVAQGRQEVVVGTLDGCVYVLSMEVNPEVVGTESHGRSRDRRNRRRRRDQSRGEKGTSGQASAAPDANSDVYSSSSTDRSRRSASPTMDGAVEDHTSRWLVGFPWPLVSPRTARSCGCLSRLGSILLGSRA